MIIFEYNRAILAVSRDYHEIVDAHLRSLVWLDNNLESDQYRWGGRLPAQSTGGSFLITTEYLYFERETDLLAFRLSTGL